MIVESANSSITIAVKEGGEGPQRMDGSRPAPVVSSLLVRTAWFAEKLPLRISSHSPMPVLRCWYAENLHFSLARSHSESHAVRPVYILSKHTRSLRSYSVTSWCSLCTYNETRTPAQHNPCLL